MALKVASATWAKNQGFASMLAVNDRLGFNRDQAQIEYLKDL